MNKWKLHTSPLNTKNMYTIIRLSSIIFFMTFILSSCDKDPLDACAEDPTCEYFRCKVNGEWWTPDCEDGPLFGCRHTDVQYYRDLNGGGLTMNVKKESQQSGFLLSANNIQSINTKYEIYRKNGDITRYYEDENKDKVRERYYIDSLAENYIIFDKIDTVNFILQGKFYFEGIDSSGIRKTITDGEFRHRYRF